MTGYSKRKRPFDSSRQDNCTFVAGWPTSQRDRCQLRRRVEGITQVDDHIIERLDIRTFGPY